MKANDAPGSDVRDLLATLANVDRRYRESLLATDHRSAIRLSIARLIETGVLDIAWIGEPGDNADLTIEVTAGARTDVLANLTVPAGTGLTGKVYASATLDWVNEYVSSSSITHDFDHQIQTEDVRRLIAVPMVHDGRTLGVLAAGHRVDGQFGDRAIEEVVAAANSAALAAATAERSRYASELAAHEERRRIAVELHDTVGALLYVIGTGLRGLREPSGIHAELMEQVHALEDHTARASQLLRDALRTLHASPTELALIAAVQAECQVVEARSGLRTHVIAMAEIPPIAADRLAPMIRAIREALHNVEKHASAHAVVVSISADDTDITVAVIDDGCGYAPNPANVGIGLSSTAETLAGLGGKLDVQPNPEGGTCWRAQMPR